MSATKDPAVLFYINDWLTSTAEMDADARGWYLNLLLHNYDKGSLPNNIEKLAVLCNVKFSEFNRFKQVFEQVFKQKFNLLENDRLSNPRTDTVLKDREYFKEKRSIAGKTSYVMKYFAKNYRIEYSDKEFRDYVKLNFDYNIDLKNEHLLKQVFEHLFELYRNEIESINSLLNKKASEKTKNIDVDVEVVLSNYKKEIAKASNDSWRENFYMKLKLRKGSLSRIIDEFIIDFKLREHPKPKDIDSFKNHLLNWANVQDRLDKLAVYKTK